MKRVNKKEYEVFAEKAMLEAKETLTKLNIPYGENFIKELEVWKKNKKYLYRMFINHPNYIGNGRIEKEISIENNFIDTRARLIEKIRDELAIELSKEIKEILFSDDSSTLENGQKKSRYLLKELKKYNVNISGKLEAYIGDFFKNEQTIKYTLSINPVDYLTMSCGENWSSCANLDNERKLLKITIKEGNTATCGQSGTIAYMKDKYTIVGYEKGKLDNGQRGIVRKISRILIHTAKDWDRIIFNRMYPQNSGDIQEKYEIEIINNIIPQNEYIQERTRDNMYKVTAAYPDMRYSYYKGHTYTKTNKNNLKRMELGSIVYKNLISGEYRARKSQCLQAYNDKFEGLMIINKKEVKVAYGRGALQKHFLEEMQMFRINTKDGYKRELGIQSEYTKINGDYYSIYDNRIIKTKWGYCLKEEATKLFDGDCIPNKLTKYLKIINKDGKNHIEREFNERLKYFYYKDGKFYDKNNYVITKKGDIVNKDDVYETNIGCVGSSKFVYFIIQNGKLKIVDKDFVEGTSKTLNKYSYTEIKMYDNTYRKVYIDTNTSEKRKSEIIKALRKNTINGICHKMNESRIAA